MTTHEGIRSAHHATDNEKMIVRATLAALAAHGVVWCPVNTGTAITAEVRPAGIMLGTGKELYGLQWKFWDSTAPIPAIARPGISGVSIPGPRAFAVGIYWNYKGVFPNLPGAKSTTIFVILSRPEKQTNGLTYFTRLAYYGHGVSLHTEPL